MNGLKHMPTRRTAERFAHRREARHDFLDEVEPALPLETSKTLSPNTRVNVEAQNTWSFPDFPDRLLM
jgi:hypothetical protein